MRVRECKATLRDYNVRPSARPSVCIVPVCVEYYFPLYSYRTVYVHLSIQYEILFHNKKPFPLICLYIYLYSWQVRHTFAIVSHRQAFRTWQKGKVGNNPLGNMLSRAAVIRLSVDFRITETRIIRKRTIMRFRIIICMYYRVFIKYCVFLENIPDACLSLFSLGVSVCTHTRQVEQNWQG